MNPNQSSLTSFLFHWEFHTSFHSDIEYYIYSECNHNNKNQHMYSVHVIDKSNNKKPWRILGIPQQVVVKIMYTKLILLTGCRGGGQVCCVTYIVNYSCRMFCELSINFWIIFRNVQCIPCFFIYVMVFIIAALIICLFQEVHYVLVQWYIFNIVWRYTYSIRLFLIEAKHRYEGKNIKGNIL